MDSFVQDDWWQDLRAYATACRTAHPLPAMERLSRKRRCMAAAQVEDLLSWAEEHRAMLYSEKFRFVVTTDITGLLALQQTPALHVPQVLALRGPEFDRWQRTHTSWYNLWLLHVNTFRGIKRHEHTKVAAQFPAVPLSQIMIQGVSTTSGGDAGGGEGRLWQWNGEQLIRLPALLYEWIA
jgi:hypothetical protein